MNDNFTCCQVSWAYQVSNVSWHKSSILIATHSHSLTCQKFPNVWLHMACHCPRCCTHQRPSDECHLYCCQRPPSCCSDAADYVDASAEHHVKIKWEKKLIDSATTRRVLFLNFTIASSPHQIIASIAVAYSLRWALQDCKRCESDLMRYAQFSSSFSI